MSGLEGDEAVDARLQALGDKYNTLGDEVSNVSDKVSSMEGQMGQMLEMLKALGRRESGGEEDAASRDVAPPARGRGGIAPPAPPPVSYTHLTLPTKA